MVAKVLFPDWSDEGWGDISHSDIHHLDTGIRLISSLRIQSPCQMMIGVYNHLLSKVFRFHCHSQKVIGSLGYVVGERWISLEKWMKYDELSLP